MMDSSKTLCAAFWKHTNIRPNNEIFPCCRFRYPVTKFDGAVENILHSDEYKELRKKSSAGVPIKGCEKCYYEESMGVYSNRNWFNENYTADKVSLELLEIGFNNICNLTCDGCNEQFSSAWAKKLNINRPVRTIVEIQSLPDTVKTVLFLGGEPLMTSSHLKMLKKISNKKEINIEYNTNGTFLFDQNAIDELKQFNHVKITLSIDGYGELNDKVRSGSKWENIIKFLDQVNELKFELEINSVIHLNNWRGIKELADFNNSLNVVWHCRVLTYPTHLDVANLSTAEKNELKQMLEVLDIPRKEKLLQHIYNNERITVYNDIE